MNEKVEICVYGAETMCSSCINLPSSKDTHEWLEAAISRKYPGHLLDITYIDIYAPPDDLEKREFAQRIIEEDLFYPVVVIRGQVVGEGNPNLKQIYKELEKYGYKR